MRRPVRLIIIAVLIAGVFSAWNVFGPTVKTPEGKYFYVRTGATYDEVRADLQAQNIINGGFFFDKTARLLKYQRVRPGRYEISNNSSVLALVRMLKAGRQSPVKLVINKLRTKEDFAGKIGRSFECDSVAVITFLTNNDSLERYKLDTNTALTAVIPDTYLLLWNSSFPKLFARLHSEQEEFWNAERRKKAAAKNLTTAEVYTMASIVEEETNMAGDKALVASVYQNRISTGQMLQADPTVKYAMRDFGLKRVRHGHLDFESPYNTYRHTGLPPGPICTPSVKTIDAILDAPETDYLFFVAKPDLRGYSNFAKTYAEHQVFARAYQQALDSIFLARQARNNSPTPARN